MTTMLASQKILESVAHLLVTAKVTLTLDGATGREEDTCKMSQNWLFYQSPAPQRNGFT